MIHGIPKIMEICSKDEIIFSYQVTWNKAVFFINWDHFLAHADNPTAAALLFCFIKQRIFLNLSAIRIRGLFNFQRMNKPVDVYKRQLLLAL